MPIRLFIRENKIIRFSSKIQCCARLIKHYSTGYNKVGNMDNKLQYVQAIKDIPDPKALFLFGNLFRFMPYISKNY